MNTKTYLITGGAGFIGSHLCEELVKLNYNVLAVDDLSTGRIENIEKIIEKPNFQFIRDNILNTSVMDRLSSTANIIIHLAADVGVKLVIKNPVHTLENNIKGTEVVLKNALRYGIKTILISTSEVYGKGQNIPFKVVDDVMLGSTLNSRWSYAASKMIDEFLGLAYFKEFNTDVTSVRLFNTVGERQISRYGMVIPRFIEQALSDDPVTVYGSGKQSRCFCDVRDVVRALINLSNKEDIAGEVYNVGSTEEISINNLAKLVIKLTNSKSTIVKIPYSQAYEPGYEDMYRRVPDTTRIRKLINWEPQYNLEEILINIIKSYGKK
jgi:UDP-glucose 4-epimerase